MIKVKKTDSIVDIILKMKNEKGEKIILDFPFWHSILHNYTSLKILKTKAEKKELIISTNDQTAKKIWKKIGIKYSITSNEDVIKHNYNFWEYLIYTLKWYFSDISDTLLEKWKDNYLLKYQKFYNNGKISYFLAFLIVSIILLFFVFYFAVNKTYVYIKPEIEVRERAKNFIFKEWEKEDTIEAENIIKLKKITNTVNLKQIFWTSGVKSENIKNAKWKAIIYNLFEEKVDLMKDTRLETKNWIVFLIKKEISIEAAKKENGKVIPWEKEVEIIARTKDANGKITWKRWNLKSDEVLFLPGLKEDKNKMYAITKWKIKGWSDNYKKILSEEDIENAKKILKWKLKKAWLAKLKKDLSEENKVNNVEYDILEIDWIVNYYDFEVSWISDLKIWDEIDNFEIFWTLKTEAYIFNRELLLKKLKDSIKENVLEWVEKISNIDEKSLAIVLELKRKKKPFEVKATAQVEAFFTQDFLNKNNNYTEKLKNIISGKTREEAEKILINNDKISNARIKIRPFFINNVSKLPENIEFKILK